MNQGEIFNKRLLRIVPKRRYHEPRNHAADARVWIEDHPWAFAELTIRCMEVAEAGKRFGMKAVVERMRWEGKIKKLAHEDYSFNNNHTSHISRAIVGLHPEVKPFIEMRRAKGDS